MALHIRDAEADRLVRELAQQRNISLTDAIKLAARAQLERPSLYQRIRPIRERSREAAGQGLPVDKAFYDSLNDE
ncbi:type II toxin-antitoxin system VapB family antitoxin [uncultured Enterovirga sp.]|uniref:type II toxin-antitoxin system VapB family antitoxin n=1 Tax=uncultured Enterovirga sp. TaxID=2026352 RepID=UPI0035CA6A29